MMRAAGPRVSALATWSLSLPSCDAGRTGPSWLRMYLPHRN